MLLRSDETEMRRLTDYFHKDRYAWWIPDGQALAFYSTRSGHWNYWWIRTDGSGLRQLTDFELDVYGILSRDGTGRPGSYAIYDLQKQSLRRLELGPGRDVLGGIAGWLPDSRRLVLGRGAAVVIYDTVSGATRPILAGYQDGWLGLARGGEILMVEEAVVHSDIWLMEFE